ncbi:MAG: FmdB family zinc ribbon protein [Armatimonadota bacterium]
MPTYDYECTSCGHRFERFQKMSDEPVTVCPECQGQVRRLLGSGSGFLIKGSPSQGSSLPACGRQTRCCGSDEPCDGPPCQG